MHIYTSTLKNKCIYSHILFNLIFLIVYIHFLSVQRQILSNQKYQLLCRLQYIDKLPRVAGIK